MKRITALDAPFIFRAYTFAYGEVEGVPKFLESRMDYILDLGLRLDDPDVLPCIRFAVEAAVLSKNTDLARKAGDALLAASDGLPDGENILEIVALLLMCARTLDRYGNSGEVTRLLLSFAWRQSDKGILRLIGRFVASLTEVSPMLRQSLSGLAASVALGSNP